ncbi:Suppressor of fused protein (SUFU) [Neisseria gonorrhoeae]|uniref:Suppressor of fused protein (SUFU) n=3 Tax=Neisseria TaxID=482 RepID=A0A378VSI3_NEIGO|nr:Suppressor of fused protein (SUFU) [Neisseria gonorrhoeae]
MNLESAKRNGCKVLRRQNQDAALFSDGISVNKKVGIGAQNSLRLAGIGMKSLRKMIIVEHLEHYLGEIESGIKCLDRRYHLSVSVFPSQPYKGVTTFSTLGLNRYDLNYKSRFELIFTCSEEWNKENIAAFLSGVAEYLIDNRQPILRGEIIQLPRVIIEGSKMDALYVSAPFYFDDDFRSVMANTTISFSLCLSPCINRKQNWWKRKVGMLLSSSC